MISIIIPTLNEEANIEVLLEFINRHVADYSTEVIVVDGGSTDQTVQIARKLGSVVIHSPQKGRAKQMNLGAQKASGDILYFLHADTLPPPTFLTDITQQTKQGFDCGCFRLRFDNPHPALRFYAWFTRFDINFFRFGDQSLFVRKALFCKINGFNENLKVMEDQEIISRLKKYAQFGITKKAVVTSARKYQQFGVFKLQFIFTIIVLLFYLGVSQRVIINFYKESCSGNRY